MFLYFFECSRVWVRARLSACKIGIYWDDKGVVIENLFNPVLKCLCKTHVIFSNLLRFEKLLLKYVLSFLFSYVNGYNTPS